MTKKLVTKYLIVSEVTYLNTDYNFSIYKEHGYIDNNLDLKDSVLIPRGEYDSMEEAVENCDKGEYIITTQTVVDKY